jgi:hypothetical protein
MPCAPVRMGIRARNICWVGKCRGCVPSSQHFRKGLAPARHFDTVSRTPIVQGANPLVFLGLPCRRAATPRLIPLEGPCTLHLH